MLFNMKDIVARELLFHRILFILFKKCYNKSNKFQMCCNVIGKVLDNFRRENIIVGGHLCII